MKTVDELSAFSCYNKIDSAIKVIQRSINKTECITGKLNISVSNFSVSQFDAAMDKIRNKYNGYNYSIQIRENLSITITLD